MPSISFVLSHFESSVAMGVAGAVDTETYPSLTSDATGVIEVATSALLDIFKFQSDSYDFTDASAADVKYYVDTTSWPSQNPANAMMNHASSANPIYANASANKNMVAHDFIRHLAVQLFGNHLGVDLFNNEKALLSNLRSICGSGSAGNTWYDVTAALEDVSVSGTHSALLGSTGSKYMTNASTGADNLCRELFMQIFNYDPARFQNVVVGDTPQSLPLHSGDSISFKLTLSPAAGQETVTGLNAPVPERSYRILLKLVDTPSNTAVAADESV